jgi:hypothetical protein
MYKRIASLVLSSVTLLVMSAAPAAAAPKSGDLTMFTDATGALTAGSASWLAVTWESTKKNIEHFSVVVANVDTGDAMDTGITVGYPGEGTSTGLWANHMLSKNEVDFTAIYVDVPADFSGTTITLHLIADGLSGFALVVPVVQHSGADVVQVTEKLGPVTSGGAAWVDIQFKGLAPVVTDFKVKIVEPSGLSYELPQVTFTSLHGDAQLDKNESDVVRVYIDAGTLDPGSYPLSIFTSWSYGTDARSMTGSLILVVVGTP